LTKKEMEAESETLEGSAAEPSTGEVAGGDEREKKVQVNSFGADGGERKTDR